MNNNEISTKIKNSLDSIKHIDSLGNEYWLARELMVYLDYDVWRNFHQTILKAIQSLKKTYPHIEDHFVEVDKMVKIAVGTNKETARKIMDFKLTRYACYLIAQNGDPKKEAIALAQSYFAKQTRRQELSDDKAKAIERIVARKKLTESEKKFTAIIKEKGILEKQIGIIKSAGDEALFGKPTGIIKQEMGISGSKPLADHLPTITIKAKDLATEMSAFKTQQKNLHGIEQIKQEHIDNNTSVRKMLNENGIYPERLPAMEDIKRLEKKFSEDEINALENSKLLSINILEINLFDITSEDTLKDIRDLIHNNPGQAKLLIYYGNKSEPKMMERNIAINPETVSKLRKYMIISNKE